jgi:hypothetical protein
MFWSLSLSLSHANAYQLILTGQTSKRMAIASAVGVFPALFFRGFSNSYEKIYSQRTKFPKKWYQKKA